MKYYDNYGRVHDRLFDALTSNLGEGAKRFIQPKEPVPEEDLTTASDKIINVLATQVVEAEANNSEPKPSIADEIINADPSNDVLAVNVMNDDKSNNYNLNKTNDAQG